MVQSLCIVALAFILLAASRAPAMTVVPPSFSTLVAQSTQILRVEVTGASSRWDTSANGRVIHTYYQCSIERTLKGDTASTITLRFLGGTVGDDHMALPGLPVLEVGHRYILFVAKNGEAFCPIVAATHGSYPIATDASTRAETVMRADMEPLRSLDDVSVPMQETLASTASAQAQAGMTREAFEDSIVGEVNHASTH